MIITEQKTFEKILKMLEEAKNIFLVGCGTCATSCQTGGEEEVKEIAKKLEENGKEITGWVVVDEPCDERLVKKDFRAKQNEIDKSEAVLVTACGVGVQAVAELLEKPVFSALDTLFLGKTKRIGNFNETCVLCGDCILEETGGICPVARCAKRLLNGPCGGSSGGKCEVDPAYDCAWYLIYERAKKLGKLDILKKTRKPKDYTKMVRPRKIEVKGKTKSL